jgi:glycosyltransferase involved in cell wall biosynthesis
MIKDLLTIVIPCKNERDLITFSLGLLNKQYDIRGTRVIISDSSDDLTRELISKGNYPNLNLEIIDGGFPSVARNNGAKLCKTPFILFLDADMFLYDFETVKSSLSFLLRECHHLVTCRFRTRGKYSLVFPVFEFLRDLISHKTPCAIGGFMLFDKEVFEMVGGFIDEDLFAEDFHLSTKINPKRFGVCNKKIYTTDRRFRKKGLWYMTKMMFLSAINKNNPEFFQHDHNYWV